MSKPFLFADDLIAGYLPGVDILRGVTLELGEGELVGIIGPNGAGKSTLVKAMFGLVEVRSGTVTLADDDITALAAHETIQQVAVDERMSGNAPDRHSRPIVFDKVLTPNDAAILSVQAPQVSFCPQGIDSSRINGGRTTRASRIRQLVFPIVLVLPQQLARVSCEAEHSFHSLQLIACPGIIREFPRATHVVHQIDFAPSHGRSGITEFDGSTPFHFQALSRETFDNTGFPPDAVPFRTEPLGPVVCQGGGSQRQDRQQQDQERNAHCQQTP